MALISAYPCRAVVAVAASVVSSHLVARCFIHEQQQMDAVMVGLAVLEVRMDEVRNSITRLDTSITSSVNLPETKLDAAITEVKTDLARQIQGLKADLARKI